MVKKRLLYWGLDASWEEILHEVWNGVNLTITGEPSFSSVPLIVVPERNMSSYFSPSGVQVSSRFCSEESWSESIRYFIGISDWDVWFTPAKSEVLGVITSSSAEYGLVTHGQSGLFGSLPGEKKNLKFEEKFHQSLCEPPQQPLLLWAVQADFDWVKVRSTLKFQLSQQQSAFQLM